MIYVYECVESSCWTNRISINFFILKKRQMWHIFITQSTLIRIKIWWIEYCAEKEENKCSLDEIFILTLSKFFSFRQKKIEIYLKPLSKTKFVFISFCDTLNLSKTFKVAWFSYSKISVKLQVKTRHNLNRILYSDKCFKIFEKIAHCTGPLE